MSVRTSPNAGVPTGSQSPDGYFVVVNGRRFGPLGVSDLRSVGVTESSWAWHPGLSNWQRVEQIEKLRQLLFAEPPPLPMAVPADAVAPDAAPSVVDFKRAVPFLAGIVLVYLLTGPALWLLSSIGMGGGIVERLVAELPLRICGAGASFFLARATRLPLAWAWAVPALLNPFIGLAAAIGLAVFARRRLKAAGVAMGFFGPRG
jgi:hypothetical protein